MVLVGNVVSEDALDVELLGVEGEEVGNDAGCEHVSVELWPETGQDGPVWGEAMLVPLMVLTLSLPVFQMLCFLGQQWLDEMSRRHRP